jgi:hypothetical protein
MTCNWPTWVSAKPPHVIGADPDDGQGICCLVVAAKVRRSAGLAMSDLSPQWFAMATTGDWEQLLIHMETDKKKQKPRSIHIEEQ